MKKIFLLVAVVVTVFNSTSVFAVWYGRQETFIHTNSENNVKVWNGTTIIKTAHGVEYVSLVFFENGKRITNSYNSAIRISETRITGEEKIVLKFKNKEINASKTVSRNGFTNYYICEKEMMDHVEKN